MRAAFALMIFASIPACGTTPTDDGSTFDCTQPNLGTDTFVVGLDKPGKSGTLDVKMMSVTPAPPERGDNTWLVQIDAMDGGVVGAPIDSTATITVTPYMPAHMHGTPVDVVITPQADAGSYELSPVNLWMPGVWQTTIAVTRNGNTDSAMYAFCLPD